MDLFDREDAFLIAVIALSSYMFVGGFDYALESAIFPQTVAVFLIISSLLILFKRFLPRPVHLFVAKPFSLRPDEEESMSEGAESEPNGGMHEQERSVKNSTFVAALMVAYLVVGYLIGFLYVTPLFAVAYGKWFDLSRQIVIMITTLTTLIALVFILTLNAPFDIGVLTRGIFV